MSMKLHLVTGGCGFVGRNMVKYLKDQTNDFILIVDDLSTGLEPNLWLNPNFDPNKTISVYEDRIIFIQEDIRTFCRNYNTLSKQLESIVKDKVLYQDVFHFAAVVGGRLDINFTTIKNPDLTYGWAKLTGEYLAQLAVEKYELHVTCIRPFSGYGSDQDLTYPIPAIARRFAQKENPIEVWGDGTQSRDFVYIDDVIDCTLIAMDKISDGTAINIGSGIQTSFLEVINTYAKISGHKADVKTCLDKPVGVHHRYCSIEKAKNLLNWSPIINLENGLTKVYKKQLSDLKAGGQ